MNSEELKRLKVLKKRLSHLKERLSQEKYKDLSYDKAEASALDWAIKSIEENLKS